MVTLYGISNCDTVKKARKFLDNRAVDYRFHDFRKDGLDAKYVSAWLADVGAEALINKRSRTWKELDPKQQAAVTGKAAAQTVAANPTLIKRPLLEIRRGKAQPKRWVGFDQATYTALFS